MLDLKSETRNARVPVAVVFIAGDIDSSNYQTFQAYVDALLEQDARYVLLDLGGVQRISSAGLRVVHNLFNKLRDLHKDVNDDELRKKMSAGTYKSPYLKLANLAPQVADVFNLGGFEIYIEIFDDTTAALSSF